MQTKATVLKFDNAYRQALIDKAKNGDEAALAEYRKINRGLEEKIIKQYAKYVGNDEIEDLRQEGLIGLLRGIAKYDLSRGTASGKPEGYIYSWVRAYISNYTKNRSGKGQHISECEVFDETVNIYETMADEDNIDADELCGRKRIVQEIKEMLKKLTPKDRLIVEKRMMGDAETLGEIGLELGISRERVRQIEIVIKAKIERKLGLLKICAA